MYPTASFGSQVEITSLVGVAGSLPMTFTVEGTGDPGDPIPGFSSIVPRVEICTGQPDCPGTVVFTLDESNGRITRDNSTGKFTWVLSEADTRALPAGEYAYRFLFFVAGVCTARPYYGRWRHQRAR